MQMDMLSKYLNELCGQLCLAIQYLQELLLAESLHAFSSTVDHSEKHFFVQISITRKRCGLFYCQPENVYSEESASGFSETKTSILCTCTGRPEQDRAWGVESDTSWHGGKVNPKRVKGFSALALNIKIRKQINTRICLSGSYCTVLSTKIRCLT